MKKIPSGYNDTQVGRLSPSAGSFSYSKGHKFVASRDVAAGEELFLGMMEKDYITLYYAYKSFLTFNYTYTV